MSQYLKPSSMVSSMLQSREYQVILSFPLPTCLLFLRNCFHSTFATNRPVGCNNTLEIRRASICAFLCYSVRSIFAALAFWRQPLRQAVCLQQLRRHFREQPPPERADHGLVIAAARKSSVGRAHATRVDFSHEFCGKPAAQTFPLTSAFVLRVSTFTLARGLC
jgi:hypothetical protein